jgi:hypothetical protein
MMTHACGKDNDMNARCDGYSSNGNTIPYARAFASSDNAVDNHSWHEANNDEGCSGCNRYSIDHDGSHDDSQRHDQQNGTMAIFIMSTAAMSMMTIEATTVMMMIIATTV